MMEGQQHGDRLKRGLKNRHIQLIALGGLSAPACFWERIRHSVRRPGYYSWLRDCRFYRLSDHASAG
jgi:hypothetical protein